jgi:hypothetical protein
MSGQSAERHGEQLSPDGGRRFAHAAERLAAGQPQGRRR